MRINRLPFFTIVVGLALIASACVHAEVFRVRGADRTCWQIRDLDIALQEVSNFADWDEADFDAAIAWATACAGYGDQIASSFRVPTLRLHENKVVFAPQRVKAEQQRLADEVGTRQRFNSEQSEKQQTAERERLADEYAIRQQHEAEQAALAESRKNQQVAADARLQQRASCQSTKRYQLYEAQENIISNIRGQSELQEARAHERRIADVSGVRDLANERAIGESLVELSDDLKDRWETYKRLGGTAKSPKVVKHTVNPCPE